MQQLFQGCFKDQFRTAHGLIISHGERRARAYNWGLGQSPRGRPGAEGRAPGRGSGEQSPPEAEGFPVFCMSTGSRKFGP